jgi:N-6 DNA Methylase
MYNLQKSNIQTPLQVSRFIYELLKDKIPRRSLIFDPCCGEGSLLKPWKDFTGRFYATYGIDLNHHESVNFVQDFLTWDMKNDLRCRIKPQLVLCNPPFNGYGNKLCSEV